MSGQEDAAWAEFVTMMRDRITDAKGGLVSGQSFDDIVNAAIERAKGETSQQSKIDKKS